MDATLLISIFYAQGIHGSRSCLVFQKRYFTLLNEKLVILGRSKAEVSIERGWETSRIKIFYITVNISVLRV